MPRSSNRRLELLEGRATQHPKRMSAVELFDRLARSAANPGDPLGRSAAFQTAWSNYLAARERVDPASEPPPDYKRSQPAADRQSEWRSLDHPALKDAVVGVLQAVIAEWGLDGPPG